MERFNIELWHCSEQGYGSLDKNWWQASCDGVYHARAETPHAAVAEVVTCTRCARAVARAERSVAEPETKSGWPTLESILRSVNPEDKV